MYRVQSKISGGSDIWIDRFTGINTYVAMSVFHHYRKYHRKHFDYFVIYRVVKKI